MEIVGILDLDILPGVIVVRSCQSLHQANLSVTQRITSGVGFCKKFITGVLCDVGQTKPTLAAVNSSA